MSYMAIIIGKLQNPTYNRHEQRDSGFVNFDDMFKCDKNITYHKNKNHTEGIAIKSCVHCIFSVLNFFKFHRNEK